MKITVITPTFNSEKTIDQNVHSVLSQTHKNFEHIIIDNLSEDNTIKNIEQLYQEKSFRDNVKIISEQDEGIADAFNKGIKLAAGEIIGILNSDDVYYNDTVFEKVVQCFENKNILFIHGNIFFDDPVYGSNIRKPLLCSITKAMPYNHPTMFFKKEVYTNFGHYDSDFKYAMDFEFISRLKRSISNLESISYYLDGDPIVTMRAGGSSWKNELNTIEETKIALKKHRYWNINARKIYILRRMRTKIKIQLTKLGMEKVVTFWRKQKWEK